MRSWHPLFAALAWGGALLLVLLMLPASVRAQAPSCDDALATAEDHYFEGRLDAARTLLDDCLEQESFADAQKIEAYTLLLRIHHDRDDAPEVEATLTALLTLVPDYEPDAGVPPSLRRRVEAFRETWTPPPPSVVEEEQPAEDVRDVEEDEPSPVEPEPPAIAVSLAETPGGLVRNLQLAQDDRQVTIRFDLSGPAKNYAVRLLLSTDGGRTFQPLPEAVRGDVGKNIAPGAGKQIVWNVRSDFPDGLAGEQYRVQVVAEKQGGRTLLYVLGGALVAGGGATLALALGGSGGGDGGGNGGGGPTLPPPIADPPGRPSGN